MKQSLTQGLTQIQKLSPLHIQTIKLLEMTTLELEQRIKREIEENPVIDEVISTDEDGEESQSRDISLSEYGADDPTPSYKTRINNQGKDIRPEYVTISVKESFIDSLNKQLGYYDMDEKSLAIARFLIGMLDSGGYLRDDLSSLVDRISFRLNIDTNEKELEQILSVIQTFDPVGIGARNLQECLLLQLRARKVTPEQQNAISIIEDCFPEFEKMHYDKIKSKLSISQEDLKLAIDEIRKLNPTPGGQIDESYADRAQQIVPDFYLDCVDGNLELSMPRFSIPELRVNQRYADMLLKSSRTSAAGKEAAAFVKQKLDSAKWFIEAIKQRQNTLMNTVNAIIDYQRDYFMEGDITKLRPMVLKNIAEKTNLDISTISRVVSSKYIQTHFGIFKLNYFFSEGLITEDGIEVSTLVVKSFLIDAINKEDKSKPLTDDELVGVLGESGFKIARRTIAKYREQLNIPISRLRKQL